MPKRLLNAKKYWLKTYPKQSYLKPTIGYFFMEDTLAPHENHIANNADLSPIANLLKNEQNSRIPFYNYDNLSDMHLWHLF